MEIISFNCIFETLNVKGKSCELVLYSSEQKKSFVCFRFLFRWSGGLLLLLRNLFMSPPLTFFWQRHCLWADEIVSYDTTCFGCCLVSFGHLRWLVCFILSTGHSTVGCATGEGVRSLSTDSSKVQINTMWTVSWFSVGCKWITCVLLCYDLFHYVKNKTHSKLWLLHHLLQLSNRRDCGVSISMEKVNTIHRNI